MPLASPVADRLVAALDPQTGERCLDVGCGRGVVSRLLADRVGPQGEVLGIDPSEDLVRLAAQDVPSARFAVGDVVAPGPADAGWDLIASGLVVASLSDPVSTLAAWRSRLRRRGRLAVAAFGTDALPALPALEPGSAERTEELCRAAGLVDVHTVRSAVPVVVTTDGRAEDVVLDVQVTTGRQRL